MHRLPELRDEQLYDLLEAVGQQARSSVHLLVRRVAEGAMDPAAMAELGRESARLTSEIRHHLLRAIVVSLPKADVEALASGLGEIPPAAHRFAERLGLPGADQEGADFGPPLTWLEELSEVGIDMIRQLRGFDSLDRVKELYARLRRMAEHAETLTDEVVTRTYQRSATPLHLLRVKDLGEQLQIMIDRYRGAGELMNRVALDFC